MEEQIRDLLDTIMSGDVAASQDKFNNIALAKASSALDDLRVDTAKTMFNQETAEQ